MNKEKYREGNAQIGIENIRKGHALYGGTSYSFATALRVYEHDLIAELFDAGKTNAEVVEIMHWPLRTVQDHREKYYKSQKKK